MIYFMFFSVFFSFFFLCSGDEVFNRTKRDNLDPGHPCFHFSKIVNSKRRISNKINDSIDPICDRAIFPRWYKFDGPAGWRMPNYCVGPDTCGTNMPIWFRETHGAAMLFGQVVKGTACQVKDENCCFRNWEIEAAHCGDFLIYKLNTPPDCYSAYCAGEETSCPPGTNSLTGFTPDCTTNFPAMTGKVVLRVNLHEPNLNFYCDYIGRMTGDSTVIVDWFVQGHGFENDDRPVWTDEMMDRKRSVLTEGRWKKRLGSTVFCQMRSRWRNQNGVDSPPIESEKFFAGIRILKRNIRISESGEAAFIHLQSTVPVTCLPEFENNCEIIVELQYNDDLEEHREVVFGDCLLKLTPENWNQVHKIPVKAVRDFFMDGSQTRIINFKKIYTTVAADIWNDYQLPPVTVTTFDSSAGVCNTFGDPHMITFDELLYHLFLEGEFVLYENTQIPIKVHIRTQKCANNATCNCAMAVAVYDDVIVVDRCDRKIKNRAFGKNFPDGWNTLHRHALEQGASFAEGFGIYEHDEGRRYTIHLPTGSYVSFEVTDKWVNIQLYASSDDLMKTRGLCGFFDGRPENDFRMPDGSEKNAKRNSACGSEVETCDFVNAWRVKPEESLFKQSVPTLWNNAQVKPKEIYCSCIEKKNISTITCEYNQLYNNYDADFEKESGTDVTRQLMIRDFKHRGGRRMKRAIHEDQSIDEYFNSAFVHDESFFGNIVERRSKHESRIICQQAFNSVEFKLCLSNLKNSDKDHLLSSCIIDVQMADSKTALDSAISQMFSVCKSNIHQKAKTEKEVDNKMSQICPMACSKHGSCYKRKCLCDQGWLGETCSIDSKILPSNLRLANGGLCETDKSCKNAVIFGKNIKKTDEFECIIKHELKEWKEKGKFINFEQMNCPLNEEILFLANQSLYLNLTIHLTLNQEIHLSNFSQLILYNSVCAHCFSPDSCQMKGDSCFIEKTCYGEGETKEEDCCLVCNPTIDQFSFTRTTKKIITELTRRELTLDCLKNHEISLKFLHACDLSVDFLQVPSSIQTPKVTIIEEMNLLTFQLKPLSCDRDQHVLRMALHSRCQQEELKVLYFITWKGKCLGKRINSEEKTQMSLPVKLGNLFQTQVDTTGLLGKIRFTFFVPNPTNSIKDISLNELGVLRYVTPTDLSLFIRFIEVSAKDECGNTMVTTFNLTI